jgi:hypothetical protein
MIGTLGQFVKEIRDKLLGVGAPIPVDIGSATVNIDADVVAEFDNVEEALGSPADAEAATDGATSGLIGLVKRLLGKTPALVSGRVPVDGSGVTQPVSDAGGSLTVDGKAYRSIVTITRPSNTTAYTAGDVVGDTGGSAILTLTNIGPSGGMVLIQSAALIFSDSTVISGMGAFRIHLYSASPTSIADNAPFDLVSGERANYMGFIDLPAPLDLGSTLYTQADSVGRLVKLASASTTIFAEIETRGAYTPASGSTIELRMSTMEAGL